MTLSFETLRKAHDLAADASGVARYTRFAAIWRILTPEQRGGPEVDLLHASGLFDLDQTEADFTLRLKTPSQPRFQLDLAGALRAAYDYALAREPLVDGWAGLGSFGTALRALLPGFTPQQLGHKRFARAIDIDGRYETTRATTEVKDGVLTHTLGSQDDGATTYLRPRAFERLRRRILWQCPRDYSRPRPDPYVAEDLEDAYAHIRSMPKHVISRGTQALIHPLHEDAGSIVCFLADDDDWHVRDAACAGYQSRPMPAGLSAEMRRQAAGRRGA